MNLYLVTGHTRGIGRALVEHLGQRPQTEIIGLGRAPEGPLPGGVQWHVDLSDVAAVERVLDRLAEHVDGRRYAKAVLFNNAGVIQPIGPLAKAHPRALANALTVNLAAPMMLMGRFLATLEPVAAVRRVVNISSGAGRRPIQGWGHYCAAKAGLDMATRVLAMEADAGVQVVSVAPGVIDTGMQEAIRASSPADFLDHARFVELKAKGELRDAAAVAADLLRHEASGALFAEPVADLRALNG
jgi:NAD(P)-dependent dehydrogenase (short-subunit alcohol dehydrogenase family)